MALMSPRLSEILVKTTHSKDIDDALRRVLSEYLEFKLRELEERCAALREKWHMRFDEFELRFREGTLGKDSYSFDVEKEFWEWEEAETLRKHYRDMSDQWR